MSSAVKPQSRYVSLRWRLILPTFIIVLVLAMSSSYVVARSLPSSVEMSRVNMLFSTGEQIAQRAAALYQSQQAQAQQLAQMPELSAALQGGSTGELNNLLENFARRGEIDSVIVTDVAGQPLAGLSRDFSGGYRPVSLAEAQGQTLFTSAQVNGAGTVMVGINYSRWIDQVRESAAAEIAIYGESSLQATTIGSLPAMLPQQYVGGVDSEPFQALQLNGSPYLGAYFPLSNAQAVVGVFMPDNAPFAVEAGQQLVALTLATVVGGIIITLFVMTNFFLERLNRVRRTAEALAEGDFSVRTGMKPTDEIGALGHAIDLYTEHIQARHDTLRASLRRQRREIEHLTAVMESLPDGVIIEDLDGNVTLINERAKRLVGANHNFFKRAELREITAAVTDTLGPAYAPGLYSLGTPQRIELDGKMLRVQSFAVMSLADQRVGTVIVVRDVTAEARRERNQLVLLEKMGDRMERPVSAEVMVTREIKRNLGSLQKLIVEMRELVSTTDAQLVHRTERNLPLETLIWAVANEWKQVAQAANVNLTVNVERQGLHVVGDERRLRWALGNIIDNAIKYTPPGGKIFLEIKDEENGFARMRVRDTGVGIAADELPHVFTRFYRGTPTSVTGRALKVPGTGQGLTIARQIVEAAGGKMNLRSSPGVGTAVYFTLPLAPAISLEQMRAEDEEEDTLQLGTSSQTA